MDASSNVKALLTLFGSIPAMELLKPFPGTKK
jgi:hypothetical protein